jgi:hypothetical protein
MVGERQSLYGLLKYRYVSAIIHNVISQTTTAKFYVLLTVHLGLVFVNNQLDAQFFFRMYLFIPIV